MKVFFSTSTYWSPAAISDTEDQVQTGAASDHSGEDWTKTFNEMFFLVPTWAALVHGACAPPGDQPRGH